MLQTDICMIRHRQYQRSLRVFLAFLNTPVPIKNLSCLDNPYEWPAQGSSFDLHFAASMSVRAIYYFVAGFAGLFAMQGCGGSGTTAAATATTASP